MNVTLLTAQPFRTLCFALIFIFCAISLIADDIGSAMFFVLALMGFAAAFYPKQQEPLPREIKLVFFAIGLFFVVALLAYVIVDGSDNGYKRLGRYARFLLAIPIYYTLRRARPGIAALWWGVCVGAILAGLAAMDQMWWQAWYPQADRASGSVHPIIFGDMSLLLAALSLAASGYFSKIHRGLLAVPGLAAVMGMCGSFLSGSRGGWLALPALAIVFAWYARDKLKAWQLAALGVLLTAFCVAAWYAPQSGMRTRIDVAQQEISGYFNQHEVDTSVGARLEMWKAAWMIFRQHPVLGVGMGGFAVEKQALIDAGKLDPAIASYLHPHNEYAAALATRGIIGFISLLALFGIIGKVFYDMARRPQPAVQRVGVAGLIVVVSFAHFGISGDTFDRTLPITFFTLLVATLATLAPAESKKGAEPARLHRESS
ncbi:MAG: O-antigen ligase family protein [Gammaproteobacteria bacterium]|nr:O-antigen ligase family protein [Gammaproteobacteria bacterium]